MALSAFERVQQLEKEIEKLGKELEKTGDEKSFMNIPINLHELETLGGYNIHHQTEEVFRAWICQADLKRPYKEFSGGWRMRVLLAKMILQQPDLLLLDEPTNHLDLPSIEWLEKYLQHYQGSVVIVSHDKYFLNRMVTKDRGSVPATTAYSTMATMNFMKRKKQCALKCSKAPYENQQDYIRQQERFIESFRAKASKAAVAQSVMKSLDKLDRIEEVEIERPNIRINFRVDKTPGKSVG